MREAAKYHNRKDIPVGQGPIGAAHFPDRSLMLVANSRENTISEVDTAKGKVVNTFSIDAEPYDIAVTEGFWFGWFGWITCRRGGADGKGSLAMYRWRPNQRMGAMPARIGKVQGVISGFNAPEDVCYDWGVTSFTPEVGGARGPVRSAYIANTGGDTISKVTIWWISGGLTTTFLPVLDGEVYVGDNPTKISIDPITPILSRGTAPVLICSVRGEGYLAFLDGLHMTRTPFHLPVVGVRYVATYWEQ
jgi:hypothetical protein